MLTVAFLLIGAALLVLAIGEQAVRVLPLTPALVYLVIGIAGGALFAPDFALDAQVQALLVGTELALLVSLVAVGVRLRILPTWRAWTTAWLLAGPAMLVAVLLGALAASVLLGLPWGAAVVLGAMLAPTDPVLASEVQVRHEEDRDAVRIALTAEGGLNDGTALPAVAFGLALLGLAEPGVGGSEPLRSAAWWWLAIVWPIAGGFAIGAAAGFGIGLLLRQRARRGDPLERDELICIGAAMLAWGLASLTGTSAFSLVFALAVTLLLPIRADVVQSGSEGPLAARLHGFGASLERIVEAVVVIAVGAALPGRTIDAPTVFFALLLVLVVRPLSVLAVVRGGAPGRSGSAGLLDPPRGAGWASGPALGTLSTQQRRLVAWFGIRGVGSLYYLAFALSHALPAGLASRLTDATLVAIAASIVLHGLSVTRVMTAYQRRRSTAGSRRP